MFVVHYARAGSTIVPQGEQLATELKEVLAGFIEKQRKGQQLDRQQGLVLMSCHVGVDHLFER